MIALALGLGCGNARPTPASPIITTITSTAPAAAAASRAATGARTAGTGGATVAPGQARSPAARGSQAADACVEQAFQSMTREEQKIGQLFMVGLNSSDPQSQATAAAIQFLDEHLKSAEVSAPKKE